MREPNIRRRNRVFKSLHKPLTYLGVERTLFYFVCVGAVAVFNLFESLLAGVIVDELVKRFAATRRAARQAG